MEQITIPQKNPQTLRKPKPGEFEKLLSSDIMKIPKRRGSKIRVAEGEPLEVRLKRSHGEPARAIVDGRKYARTYVRDDLGAETLVRINLELLIWRVKKIVKNALVKNELMPAEGEGAGVRDIEKLCLTFEGISPRGFYTKQGRAMQHNAAFKYMIRQFFKDEDFAKRVIRHAEAEFIS